MPTLGSRLKALLTAHWAILLPGFASLYIFPYLPELRSPNELCRLHQTRALVDHGTFEIDAVLRDEGPVGDLSCVAMARDGQGRILERRPCPEVRGQARFSEEHHYPSKAPLLSLAATPVYWVLERWRGGAREVPEVPLVFFSRLLVTVLPAVLLLIPLRRFLRAHADERTADALTAAYGLGSLAFSYAELFMSHQTTAVLVFLTFYALWRTRRGDWPAWGYALSGLLAGLCVSAEYTAALALVPLAGYALLTARGGARGMARAALLGLAGVLPAACLLMAYHQTAFGHPLHSGYKYLNDAGYQGWHTGGFLGITVPSGRAFLLSFFSPLRGLFALSPFLAMGMVGLHPRFGSKDCRPELRVCAALLSCFAYFTSSFSYDSWGWTTGPRHLTPLVPFLLLPSALVMAAARARPTIAGALAGIVGLSIVATSAMTFLNYIPDSLTNALYQVALPFLTTGHLPHTWLSLLGVPNPMAAAPALVAVAGAALLATRSALPERLEARSVAAAVAAVSILVAVHASVRPRTDTDRARDASTYTFLEERYVPRPGKASPSFWTR